MDVVKMIANAKEVPVRIRPLVGGAFNWKPLVPEFTKDMKYITGIGILCISGTANDILIENGCSKVNGIGENSVWSTDANGVPVVIHFEIER